MSDEGSHSDDSGVEEMLYRDLADAHCHPHDDENALRALPDTKCPKMCVMGTRPDDWPVVEDFVAAAREKHGKEATPSFGLHPWFAHLFAAPSASGTSEDDHDRAADKTAHYATVLRDDRRKQDEEDVSLGGRSQPVFVRAEDLPEPIPADLWMRQLREVLHRNPEAVLGEIGFDAVAALRTGPYCKIGVPRGSITSTFCSLDHQRAIFRAQMRLAAELQRPVSIHSVRTQGVLVEELKLLMDEHLASSAAAVASAKRFSSSAAAMPPSVCLHSYSGSAETVESLVKMFEKAKGGRRSKRDQARFCPEDDESEGDESQDDEEVRPRLSTPEIFFS
ncbi:MAG: TatD related DNase-domain-containing protein, partial [Olpidium bornovanus]